MKQKYKKILALYEDFRVHKGELHGEEGFFDYQSPTSIHSHITAYAYGIKETNPCLSLFEYDCESRVYVKKKDLKRRFYIRLKAQLFDWEKEVCGIKITINGKLAYENKEEFFENVHVGWPTIYLPIDAELVKEGENILEMSAHSDETFLLVARLDLFSLPAFSEGCQLTARPSVREGDVFSLSFYSPKEQAEVISATECEVVEKLRSPMRKEHIIVKIKATGKNPELTLKIGEKSVKAVLPEVFPANKDFCLVGTDSDDHRHDYSDEAVRILEIFANTNMGNFWQARPKKKRNYHTLADEATWKNRIDHLKAFDMMFCLSNGNETMPYFEKLCGENFYGAHFHEAYLFFNLKLKDNEYFKKTLFTDIEALQRSESFGESKEMYREALRKMYASGKSETGLTSVGSPSLLTIYEAASGFERVTVEPTSNMNLLISAVRGTAPKKWGAHVPPDWYFGEPNDMTKARKVKVALGLLYMAGADYMYMENALFKTNAFSRKDWEDDFCVACRSYLREIYDYSIRNPREGKLKRNFAAIYGNNEYFLWLLEDRDGALYEDGDWDIKLWCKWRESSHQKCWSAIFSWLPVAKNQLTRKNSINKNLFSGTPYGQVDVIPYESDYSGYKAVTLLGWNTYEDGFGEKIYSYVENGGTAFVSYCHFNKTDRSDRPMEYASTSIISLDCNEIISVDGNYTYGENSKEFSEAIKIVKCTDGEPIVKDGKGNTIVLKKKIGKGTLYFGTFADYNSTKDRLEIMRYVLDVIGKEEADIICSNPNISFAERTMDDGSIVVDVLNMCPAAEKKEKYKLAFKDGKKINGALAPCELKRIKIKN